MERCYSDLSCVLSRSRRHQPGRSGDARQLSEWIADRKLRLRGLCLRSWACSLIFAALGAPAVAGAHGDAPAVERVRISPTGDRVLAIASGAGSRGLAVIDLATGELRIVFQPERTSAFLESCDWASTSRVVCSMYVFPRYTGVTHRRRGDGPYQRRRLVRLVAVDYDGDSPVELIHKKPRRAPKMAGVARPPPHPLDDMEHVVVHHLPDEPDHVLIAAAREAKPYTSVYKVDLRTGAPVREIGFALGILFWHADHLGSVRLGTGWYEFGHKLAPVEGRRPQEPWIGPTAVAREGDRFQRVDVSDLSGPVGIRDLAGPRVLGFAKDGSSVYYEARVKGADRTAVWQADTATLAPLRRLVADGLRDVQAIAVEGRRCGVVGFMHPLPSRPFTWLAPSFGRDVAAASAQLPGDVVAVTSMSADCRKVVLVATDGYSRRSFHLLDRDAGTLRNLGEQYPGIRSEPEEVERRTVTYATRDGLDLPMTLTLPKANAEMPPVVVILDGGPGRYSDDSLDTWPHFFASRGYVVAQPVFRGARGYGAAMLQAGMRQRAIKLQTDVADALAWLEAQGVADAERACFAGRGRGGHLALAAGLVDRSAGESVDGRCVAAFAAMDMRSTRRDRGGPYGPCMIEPCDDWRRWTAPQTLSSFSAAVGFPGSEDASMLRSPLLDAEHPGFPVLIQSGGEAVVHERGSRRFRAGLDALSTFQFIAPVGSAAEVAYLEAAEELFAEVLMSPETPAR